LRRGQYLSRQEISTDNPVYIPNTAPREQGKGFQGSSFHWCLIARRRLYTPPRPMQVVQKTCTGCGEIARWPLRAHALTVASTRTYYYCNSRCCPRVGRYVADSNIKEATTSMHRAQSRIDRRAGGRAVETKGSTRLGLARFSSYLSMPPARSTQRRACVVSWNLIHLDASMHWSRLRKKRHAESSAVQQQAGGVRTNEPTQSIQTPSAEHVPMTGTYTPRTRHGGRQAQGREHDRPACWVAISRGAHSLVEYFAVEGLLLHVGLPRPPVLLVGE